VAGTSVGENPRWVRCHRIFVYTCKQSNIMCSCCVWPHGNSLVGFYSLQKLYQYMFFCFQSIIWVCSAKGRYIPTYTGWRYIGRHIRIYIADVVEWSRAVDIRLSYWCCSVSTVWVQIPSREEQNLTAQRSNSNTVWFKFQMYIFINVWKSSQRMNLRDVGSETSVNDSVQTNKNDK
jgi:hypothetical protein